MIIMEPVRLVDQLHPTDLIGREVDQSSVFRFWILVANSVDLEVAKHRDLANNHLFDIEQHQNMLDPLMDSLTGFSC